MLINEKNNPLARTRGIFYHTLTLCSLSIYNIAQFCEHLKTFFNAHAYGEYVPIHPSLNDKKIDRISLHQ